MRYVAAIVVVGVIAVGCGSTSKRQEPSRATTVAHPAGLAPQFAATLRRTLDRVRRDQAITGATAAVVFPDGSIWTGRSGVADRRTRRPLTDDTLFAAGSITKTFVAALAAKLADRGVLGLDDRLRRWLPQYRYAGRITLRNLLMMRSGLPSFTDNPAFFRAQRRSGGEVWTPERTLRYGGPPTGRPGGTWEYSNTNYLLVGLAIERATHLPLARALHRYLLARADFPRVLLQPGDRPHGSLAVGYRDVRPGAPPQPTPNDGYVPSTALASAAGASGAMLASARDLARAGAGVFRGTLLSAAARAQMTRFVETGQAPPDAYGLGLGRDVLGGQRVWIHSGDIDGFHADLAYLPKYGVTVAALNDYERHQPGARDLVEGLIADVARRAG